MGCGMLHEFTCHRCKLRAVWTYAGPPGICVWFDAPYRSAANEYLRAIQSWREQSFASTKIAVRGGFTWDMTPPPAPTADLFLVCIDMNHQHVELKPRKVEG